MKLSIETAIMVYSVPIALFISILTVLGMTGGYALTASSTSWIQCMGTTCVTFCMFVIAMAILYKYLPKLKAEIESTKTEKDKKRNDWIIEEEEEMEIEEIRKQIRAEIAKMLLEKRK